MKTPDERPSEPILERDGSEQDRNPEDQVDASADMDALDKSQEDIEGTLKGYSDDSDADEIIKEGRKNVAEGENNLSDLETEISEEDYEEILNKMMGNNESELTNEEKKKIKGIGVEVAENIKNNKRIVEWKTKEKEEKEIEIGEKKAEFEEKLFKKEIKESGEEIARKKKEIEKTIKESTEKYEDMEKRFKDLLSQNEVCNLLKDDEKAELMEILGSLSAVIRNEVDLRKLEYIETKFNNPDGLLEDHAYRIAEIENLERASDFFETGLLRLGEEEGDLLEKFMEFLKDHPELLKYAALIALLAGFAFLAEPAAEAIVATGIMIKAATVLKSAAIIGSLFAAYALTDEKQRDKFMSWITGTGKVPDWAWIGLDKYGEEKK